MPCSSPRGSPRTSACSAALASRIASSGHSVMKQLSVGCSRVARSSTARVTSTGEISRRAIASRRRPAVQKQSSSAIQASPVRRRQVQPACDEGCHPGAGRSNTRSQSAHIGIVWVMDLKSLRYFVAVAEARSVGKAAERLHMAQPPLSVQIRNLEAQVGTPLFLRESTGMRLTDAGSALFARAREALALAHDGYEAARAVGSGRRGRLAVGYMFSLGYAVLPKLVPLLRRSLPEVELQFVEMSAAACEAQIVDHSVSVGLCMPPLQRAEVANAIVGM